MGTQTGVAGAATPKAEDASQGYLTGYGTRAYRSYVLNALLIIYILSFMDRALLSVVARPLKAEIGITDFWFGMLTGAGFAILYTIVGIPLARISERKNRVWIIGISLAVWSAFTALTGLSSDIAIGGTVVLSGFMVLLLCRIGVGIGEAGCTPPANSLIADYYPVAKRSSALGYYAMGVTLGTMLANAVGGQITDAFGWRAAFYVMGLPGVAIAVLLVMTVKEPPRGYSDPPEAAAKKGEKAELWPAIQEMFSKPSYWTMTAGATLAAFCGYAIAGFQSLYLQRTFDLTAGEASLWVNTPAYLAGAVGTVFMGWLAMKLRKRSISAIAWLPAIGLAASVPFYIWGFTSTSLIICAVGLSLGHFIKYGYLAAQYTISQGVVSMRVRATATAVMLFVINILGYGLGPPFAGILSDFFFSQSATSAGFPGFTNAGCDAAQEAIKNASAGVNIADVLAGMARPISEAQYAFCGPANSAATQSSMLVITLIYALAGLCFFLCMFTLKKDLVAK
jgi:MFS family permease